MAHSRLDSDEPQNPQCATMVILKITASPRINLSNHRDPFSPDSDGKEHIFSEYYPEERQWPLTLDRGVF